MSRIVLAVLAVVLASGCFKTKIEAAQKQLDELKVQKEAAAKELAQAQAALDAAERDLAGVQNAKVTALRNVFVTEGAMVTLWKGHEPTMKKVLGKAALPEKLKAAAEKAQKSAGSETLEQTLARAIADENKATLASLMGGWENRSGIAVPQEPEEAEASCELPDPKPRCSVLKPHGDAAICDDPETKSTWMLSVDSGFLQSARLPDASDDSKVELMQRVTPTLFLLDGTGKIDIEEGPPMRRWVDVVQFTGGKVARKARWPMRVGEGATANNGQLIILDVDADGRDDVVHIWGDRVHALREAPRTLETEELKAPQVCAKLKEANKLDEKLAAACKKATAPAAAPKPAPAPK